VACAGQGAVALISNDALSQETSADEADVPWRLARTNANSLACDNTVPLPSCVEAARATLAVGRYETQRKRSNERAGQ
jgi:hypothetical protein